MPPNRSNLLFYSSPIDGWTDLELPDGSLLLRLYNWGPFTHTNWRTKGQTRRHQERVLYWFVYSSHADSISSRQGSFDRTWPKESTCHDQTPSRERTNWALDRELRLFTLFPTMNIRPSFAYTQGIYIHTRIQQGLQCETPHPPLW